MTDTYEKGTSDMFLTTVKLPAWVIVMLYNQRWDIEKVFDEIENRMRRFSIDPIGMSMIGFNL